jgi:arylformamidase
MTPSLIDISMPLSERLPVWPGSSGASVARVQTLSAGAESEVSELTMDVHTGTHLDAPSHMLSGAAGIGEYALEDGLGEVLVADTGEANALDAKLLDSLDVPLRTQRLLLRTRNSRRPELRAPPFATDYTALTLDGADWLVARGLRLVGIDYLSIQRYGDPVDTHLALFRGGVTVLEGLWLADAPAGRYELLCLPMKLVDCEAAPARAVLRKIDG